MDPYRAKQIETLVRLGLMPVQLWPWLQRAIAHTESDAFLPVNERKVYYSFINRLMDLVFNDELMYRLLRQRTSMKKFEEFNPISEEEIDLKRTPEGMLSTMANAAKNKEKAGGKVSPSEKRLASKAKAELRRRRDNLKGRMEESSETDSPVISESYEQAFMNVLTTYNVTSVADLPKESVKEFFNKVEQLYNSGE